MAGHFAWSLFRSPRTELFKSVKLYTGDSLKMVGSLAVDTGEETMHHCSGLLNRVLWVRVILWRWSWNGRPLNGATVEENLCIIVQVSLDRALLTVIHWRWSWNGKPLGSDSGTIECMVTLDVSQQKALWISRVIPMIQSCNSRPLNDDTGEETLYGHCWGLLYQSCFSW